MENVTKGYFKKLAATEDTIEVKFFLKPQGDTELLSKLAKNADRDILIGFGFPQTELDIDSATTEE